MTIIEQLSNAQERIKELEASASKHAEQLAASDAAQKASSEVTAKAVADLKVATEKHVADVAEKAKVLESEQAAHKATAADLAKVKLALANPAFADAALAGSKKPVAEGGSPATDVPITKEQAQADYRKLESPRDRQEFRKANWKVLGIAEEK